jgi:membrane-associated phospholipid phosphatase
MHIVRRWYPLFLLGLFPIVDVAYTYLNQYHHDAKSIAMILDLHTPFVKEFIVPYQFWYIFVPFCLVYFLYLDKPLYLRAVFSCFVGLVINNIIYFFFQTTVERPILAGNDIFTNIVLDVYESDQPYNCFPSTHVLTTYSVMIHYYFCHKKNAYMSFIIYLTTILIILSTMFVKQHVILDVIASMLISHILYFVFKRIIIIDQKSRYKTIQS